MKKLFVIGSCVAIAAFGQQTVNYASLGGTISDASGGVIEGVDVTARQVETNITTVQKTGANGRYQFPYLRVGAYEVSVRKAGFQSVQRPVTLTVGAAFDMPFSLIVAATATEIQIIEEAPVLEAARTQIASTISRAELENLPLSGRNYLDVALFTAGVSPTNTAANQLFAETAAVPGQGISVGSQRNFSNNFIIDGVSANDDAAGVAGTYLGLDSVQEFQVVTSGGQAELGRALGGYINVVTKSGTNTLHGDVYGYFRNSRFNAANPISHTVLPLTQAQFGASLSGPVVKDRTFYFTNYEGRDLNQSGLSTISVASVAAINARLASVGYPGPRISTGNFSNPVHSENFLAKLDHRFSSADQFTARYNLYHVSSLNSRGAGGLNAPTASANLFNTDQTLAVSNILTLSPTVVNETRGQFTNSNLEAPPSDAIGPAVSISGVATFGTSSTSPTARSNKLYEITDNVSILKGAHSIRFGVDFLYNDDSITYPRSSRGNYSFSSLANFLNGVYNNSGFTQTFNVSQVQQTNPNVGLYVQDQYTVSRHLTLNLGIRYDLQYLKTINTQTGNVSPRAGFAWTPFAGRRTVVRGSYGLFYDRIPLRPLANALLSAGNTTAPANLQQISVSLSPTQAGAPVFPNILGSLSIPAGVLFNLTTMDPNMKSAYSEQASLEIEQQIGRNGTVSLGYQHVRGLHLIASVNQNVPGCTAAGTNNGCRPNPNYANNSRYSPAADSHYDGAHISFQQRPAKWGNYRVSYTYSKALANVGEFFFSSPINNFDIWQDYGRSDDDQRHRVAFESSVHTSMEKGSTAWQKLSRGFEFSNSLTAYSPLPFNITTGSTTVQGTQARPLVNGAFISRNAGQGHAIVNLNLRVSRSFAMGAKWRLQAIAEMFNALNHRNVATLNGVFGTGAYPAAPSATFGQITAVNDPRGAQFALRVSF